MPDNGILFENDFSLVLRHQHSGSSPKLVGSQFVRMLRIIGCRIGIGSRLRDRFGSNDRFRLLLRSINRNNGSKKKNENDTFSSFHPPPFRSRLMLVKSFRSQWLTPGSQRKARSSCRSAAIQGRLRRGLQDRAQTTKEEPW